MFTTVNTKVYICKHARRRRHLWQGLRMNEAGKREAITHVEFQTQGVCVLQSRSAGLRVTELPWVGSFSSNPEGNLCTTPGDWKMLWTPHESR
jgi:hypothetical protein